MNDDPATGVLSRSPALRLVRVELSVISGPDHGQQLMVDGDRARVGTAPSNDLRLTDRAVSRLHLELQIHREGVRLIDRGSTNGTFMGGVRINDVELSHSATITVGQTDIEVELGKRSQLVTLSRSERLGSLVGGSVAMRRLYATLERIAPTDVTVLIEGETGTGKELAAQTIHELSRRAEGPFVVFDCSSVVHGLLESELFGHVRGAFTGARNDRAGAFEAADGGTLFFDELGELPLATQPKLLRAVESRTVRRVGENQSRPVDVRILAATNRSLSQSVNDGDFREDLYHRLAVVELELPPLRERRDDIPLLVGHFAELFGLSPAAVSADFIASLRGRPLAGNVRELRNLVERRVLLGLPDDGDDEELPTPRALTAGDTIELHASVPALLPLKEAREAWQVQLEQEYLAALLERTDGNVSQAARLAGINRRTLQRLLTRRGFRGPGGAR